MILWHDEFIFVSQYKQYDPGEKLTSSEVLDMILEFAGDYAFFDLVEFKRLIKRVYGVDLL